MPELDQRPPMITGGRAELACCALPLLIAASVLAGGTAAILEQTLLAARLPDWPSSRTPYAVRGKV